MYRSQESEISALLTCRWSEGEYGTSSSLWEGGKPRAILQAFNWFLLSFLIGAVLSCSGQPKPEISEQLPGNHLSSTPTRAPEKWVLKVRALAAFRSTDGGSWASLYDYLSPSAQETCERSDHAARIHNFASIVKGFMELGEDAELLLRVRDVAVDGVEAKVFIDLVSGGQRVEYGEIPELRWVLLDGEWWVENQDWRDGCVGWKLFQ